MAFHVFPDELGNHQEKPLLIAANTSSAQKDMGAFSGSGTKFIRISKDSGPDPQVFLTAGGPEVQIPVDLLANGFTTPVFLADTVSDAGDAHVTAAVSGVYLLTISLNQAASWKLRIVNTDLVNDHNFVWVVADSDAESKQPWIHVAAPPPAIKSFAGQDQTQSFSVANRGTGDLNLQAGAAPGSGFAITTIPPTIGPNSSGNVVITYTGAAVAGQVTVPYTATALPPDTTVVPLSSGHNNHVIFTGDTALIETVFLVDASGSMAYTPDGLTAALPDQARWGKLKAGAAQSWDLLAGFAVGKGKFALAQFPDITTGVVPAPSPSSKVLLGASDISVANIGTAQAALDGHTPVQNGGATPMGHGLGTAMGGTPGSFGLFQSGSDALNFNARFLILQSDGANNSGPPNPTFFYPPGDAAEPVGNFFTDKKITVISVGYGKPGTPFEVDNGLLSTLATNSVNMGYFLNAFADDSGMALRKQFRQAIIDVLHLDPASDPTGILTSAQPEARYEIPVLTVDTKVAFVVDWVTRDAPIRVSLVTPLCEVITEQSAAKTAGIFFRSGPFHRLFVVDSAFLSNAAKPTQPRYGAWKLIITYSPDVIEAAAPIVSEQFEYEVITESRLKMDVQSDRPRYGAGDRITISASVQLDGVGIPNASVLLNVVAPGQSSNNFIASTPVSAALLERARAALSKEDVTAVGIKSFAIGLKGVAFNDFKRTLNIPMTDPGKSGVYSASIDETSVPEGYEFYVTAVGLLPTGEAFRRERRASKNVDVIPVREFTLVDVVYATGQATVRIIPKDKLGNFMPLFDPQFNPRIGITATGGAELRGGLTFNGDGSYSGTLVYPPTANPVIQVSVDGNVLVPSFPLQPVAEMIWVDQVVAFKLGSEAKPGANTHKDPGAALGDPLTKDPNLFVSLGGGGSLTVEIKGQVILNTGGSEITVFVEPDSSLRAYKVEAGYAGNQWVTLGTSSGITESFSFGKLSAARAIRISDLSVQIRDVDLNPLATPGVSVRAVGVKSTTKDSGGGGTGDICLRIRALNPKREPLGGTVDIEFRPVEVGPFVKVEKVDASKDIDVSGLQRTPQGLYEVTVIPNDVFKPTGQFVTVPASGFATVEFIIDKTK